MSKERVLQAVVEHLAADLAEAEARIQSLESTQTVLTRELADATMREAFFETMARAWLTDISASKAAADRLRDENRRIIRGHFPPEADAVA